MQSRMGYGVGSRWEEKGDKWARSILMGTLKDEVLDRPAPNSVDREKWGRSLAFLGFRGGGGVDDGGRDKWIEREREKEKMTSVRSKWGRLSGRDIHFGHLAYLRGRKRNEKGTEPNLWSRHFLVAAASLSFSICTPIYSRQFNIHRVF